MGFLRRMYETFRKWFAPRLDRSNHAGERLCCAVGCSVLSRDIISTEGGTIITVDHIQYGGVKSQVLWVLFLQCLWFSYTVLNIQQRPNGISLQYWWYASTVMNALHLSKRQEITDELAIMKQVCRDELLITRSLSANKCMSLYRCISLFKIVSTID